MTEESPGGVRKRKSKQPKPRKVAILGTTPSRMQAPIEEKYEDGPWKDEYVWEIWTIGPGGKDHHRWDRLFETHGTWPESFKDYLNDISKVKSPQQVFTIYPMKQRIHQYAAEIGKDEKWLAENVTGDWKANVVIDREALFEKHRRMWFSSSISYCIAIAIEEGIQEFGLWGIDLESGEEYISQHTGCAHFLDLARHLGCNIHMPVGCGLLRDLTPYPDRYETVLALTLEKKAHYLEHMIKNNEPELDGLRMMMHRSEGVLSRNRELMEIAAKEPAKLLEELSPERCQKIEQALHQYNVQLGNATAQMNHLRGEKSATDYYRRTFVWGMVEPT